MRLAMVAGRLTRMIHEMLRTQHRTSSIECRWNFARGFQDFDSNQ